MKDLSLFLTSNMTTTNNKRSKHKKNLDPNIWSKIIGIFIQQKNFGPILFCPIILTKNIKKNTCFWNMTKFILHAKIAEKRLFSPFFGPKNKSTLLQILSCRKGALADVKDDSNVTLACDDDAHKVVLCACSIVLKIRLEPFL